MNDFPRDMPPKAMSIKEVMKSVGICRQTVMKLINRGNIHAVRVGDRWLIPVAEVDRFLQK